MTALVVYLQNTIARLRDREGLTMAEYALIIGGIAIVVIAGILILARPSVTCSSHGRLGQRLPVLVTPARSTSGVGPRHPGA